MSEKVIHLDDVTNTPVIIKGFIHDQAADEQVLLPVTVKICPDGVMVIPQGHGDFCSQDGDGCPILIDYYNGRVRATIWGDINLEDPTNNIPLDGAKEIHRREDPDDMTIPAECHSDDHVVTAQFDALPWFVQASDKDIMDLHADGWSGDYSADAVALYMEDRHAKVAKVFDYIGTVVTTNRMGFECAVEEEPAMGWLGNHRPDVFKAIEALEKASS